VCYFKAFMEHVDRGLRALPATVQVQLQFCCGYLSVAHSAETLRGAVWVCHFKALMEHVNRGLQQHR
jgi:hypothetical protein